ncbi:MAG: preprotein translocase subunit SecE [Anaerolineae bacterium]|jgi:preprotein translocase subunit SecE
MAKSRTTERTTFLGRLRDNAVTQYLRDTRAELRKVHWPSRQEAENLTKIVLGVTVSMAIFMGLLDWLFSIEILGLITSDPVAIGVAIFVVLASAVTAVIINRQMV